MKYPIVANNRQFRDPQRPPHKCLLFLLNLVTGRAPRKSLPRTFRSILILAEDKLEDGLLLIPFLNALHARFRKTRIAVIASPFNQELFTTLPYLDEILVCKKNPRRLFRLLKSRSYDIFYNPKGQLSIAAIRITRKVRAEYKVGIDHKRHNQYYHAILPNRPEVRIIEKKAELLRHYRQTFPLRNRFRIPPDIFQQARIVFKQYAIRRAICINISSGRVLRNWPTPNWERYIDFLRQKKLAQRVILLTMPEDRSAAEQIGSAFGKFIYLVGQDTPLFEAVALIAKSRLLVSPDSALIHFAAAVNTPVIGLYRDDGRNRRLFAPYQVPYQMVVSPDTDITKIAVQTVIRATERLLAELQS